MRKPPTRPFLLLLTLLLLISVESVTQAQSNLYAPDATEPGSVEAIARFTTETRFLSPWVAYVPASEKVPSPTRHLAHVVGRRASFPTQQRSTGTCASWPAPRSVCRWRPSADVRDVRRGPGGVFTPGVEVRAKFARPDHPIAYGYSEVTSAFRDNYPVYNVGVADRGLVVLQLGTKQPTEDREEKPGQAEAPKPTDPSQMLVSGGMRGEDTLEGRPAILDIPAGPGRELAYNFNPCIAT